MLCIISNILNGTEENIKMDELGDLNASEMVFSKYASTRSVDVEQFFTIQEPANR